MLFTLVDVILIAVVLIFAIIGFMFGLISAIGAIVGVIAGAFLATQYFSALADWLQPILFNHAGLARVVGFLLIFAVVNRLVALLFWLVNKIFKIVSIIPFLGPINRLAGAILGLIEGILAVGLAIYVIAKFGADIGWLTAALNTSSIAHWLVAITSFLVKLIPGL